MFTFYFETFGPNKHLQHTNKCSKESLGFQEMKFSGHSENVTNAQENKLLKSQTLSGE